MGKKFVKGLEGIVAATTSLSHIDGKKGELVYRGYSIFDLAKYSSFEEIIYLLWFEKLPKKKELQKFKKSLNKNMELSPPLKKFINSLPKTVIPMSVLRTAVSLLGVYDKNAQDVSNAANEKKAVRIMAAMPSIVAGVSRIKQGKKILNPKKNLSFAANFLYMMKGKIPSKKEEKTIDTALILHAEHGMNASTFSAIVTVSTLSDMHSAMVSAISTLKGPLHGGANKKAIQALHKLGDKIHVKNVCDISCLGKVDKEVLGLLKKHVRIMGIGHRVYKVKDPRAVILEEFAKGVNPQEIKYYQMAKEIEEVMAREKNLFPNVDFYSGIVYENLGIKPQLYVCIFALSRTSGWLAHMMEQYKDNRLIRPTTLYNGPLKRNYVKIENR